MNKIELKDLAALIKLIEKKKLGEKDLLITPLTAEVVKSFALNLEDYTFSIGASGTLLIQLFNDIDDIDDDKILGKSEESLISFKDNKAWIKYSAIAGLKASGSGSLRDAGFDLAMHKNLVLNTYQLHDPGETFLEVLTDDLGSFLTILNKEDILQLKAGEALSIHMRGRLKAGLTLSWADIFSASLNALGKLIDHNELLQINIDTAVKADFKIDIEDDFALAFTKIEEDKYRSWLKKDKSSNLGGRASASIGIEFENEERAEEVLTAVLEGLTGYAETKLKEIWQKSGWDKLSDAQKAIVEVLLKRLNIDSPMDRLNALKEKYEQLKIKARDAIQQIARTKVKAGFAYEYRRITTEAILFQAVLSEKAVTEHHGDLLRLKVNKILDKAEKGDEGIHLEAYLNEKKKEVKKAWGFSLGIGKWAAKGLDKKEISEFIRTNQTNNQQVAFNGVRKYESRWGNNEVSWLVDFNAAMDNFSIHPVALASELDYGLHLSFNYIEDKLKKEEIAACVDHAVLWKAIPAGEAERVADDLFGQLKNFKQVNFRLQLTIHSSAFASLLPIAVFLAQRNNDWIARSMGAAMPYWEDYPLRKNVELRENYYGMLWNEYLKTPDLPPAVYAGMAEKMLKEKGFPELGRREGRFVRNDAGEELLFGGIIRQNPLTAGQWRSFTSGLKLLQEGITGMKAYDKVVPDAFRAMQSFWSQSHHVRTLGAFFVSAAAERPDIKEGIASILTISYKDGEEEKVINFSTS